jgi:hypothetical protein
MYPSYEDAIARQRELLDIAGVKIGEPRPRRERRPLVSPETSTRFLTALRARFATRRVALGRS